MAHGQRVAGSASPGLASVAHLAAVAITSGWSTRSATEVRAVTFGVPGDARRRGVVLGGQPADAQHPVLAGHPVDQVVDLLVGLADDHDPLAPLGEAGGGRDHQGGLARAGRGVDDHAALGLGQVGEDGVGHRAGAYRGVLDAHEYWLRGLITVARGASSSSGTYSGGGPPWVHGVSWTSGNFAAGWNSSRSEV